jgi:small basic protein
MILIPILALILGIVVAWWVQAPITVNASFGSYLSVAALAGLDTLIGGIRSAMDRNFDPKIFVSGFAVNAITASGLAYCGDQVGIDLFLAAVVVLGGRIFTNLSIIRRHLITGAEMKKLGEEAPG